MITTRTNPLQPYAVREDEEEWPYLRDVVVTLAVALGFEFGRPCPDCEGRSDKEALFSATYGGRPCASCGGRGRVVGEVTDEDVLVALDWVHERVPEARVLVDDARVGRELRRSCGPEHPTNIYRGLFSNSIL